MHNARCLVPIVIAHTKIELGNFDRLTSNVSCEVDNVYFIVALTFENLQTV